MKARELALASVIAALYAITVYLFPMISFLLWQVRIADALMPLSMTLGYPAVLGLTIGCFLGNILAAPWGSSFLNFLDATLGSLVNLVAGWLGYKLGYRAERRRRVTVALAQAIIVSVGVGSYLKYLLLWAFNTDIPFLISILGVLPGSLISIVVVGLPLSLAVQRALEGSGGKLFSKV